ncbi:MAG: THUMP domain-containing protein [Ignavibacteriaceae bacterium]
MYNYQKTNRYFAQVADDIKDIAEEEVQSFGAKKTSQKYRGIYFSADTETLYKINYYSRLINRVLAPLISFNCHSDELLYKRALKINWEDFLDPSKTFAVFASVTNSSIKHSKFASLRLKDAIVDYFRNRTRNRPSIDTRGPDVWFNLHIEKNEATISLDTSGGSLHRRGYRKKIFKHQWLRL